MRALTIAALLFALTACDRVHLQAVDTQERVIQTTTRVLLGNSTRVRSRLEGVELHLQTSRGCERVIIEDVEITQEMESDEDPTEELVLLGISLAPLAGGIIMLADAPNVYESDRNSREYNQAGPEGAYIGGTILTSIGGLIFLLSSGELIRHGSSGETQVSTKSRKEVVDDDVACDIPSQPKQATVILRVAGRDVSAGSTDPNGTLVIDLATAIPPDVAGRGTTVEVLVGGQLVGELDIGPILDEQAIRRDRAQQIAEEQAPAPAPLEETEELKP